MDIGSRKSGSLTRWTSWWRLVCSSDQIRASVYRLSLCQVALLNLANEIFLPWSEAVFLEQCVDRLVFWCTNAKGWLNGVTVVVRSGRPNISFCFQLNRNIARNTNCFHPVGCSQPLYLSPRGEKMYYKTVKSYKAKAYCQTVPLVDLVPVWGLPKAKQAVRKNK